MFNDAINKIRDILRTEAIVGRDSINYCISFLVIKSLDEHLCQILNIDTKYTYNNLMSFKSKNELYEKIYNPTFQDFLIYHLVYKLNMNFLREFKIKSAENLYNILYTLKDLNLQTLNEQYDLIGTIYELHLKTGTINGRDLGQFFTNRKIIKYMVDIVNPQIGETILDPAMGTGGFLTMCVKHLKNVNWSEYKNNIYGFDIDEEISNLATLNLLLETGEKFGNLKCKNALTMDIQNKFDIILANEPMGLKIDYTLCSDIVKNLKIKASKSESLFMQLIMQLLKPNGRACVIVPEGFLFAENNKTKKYLMENFNVKKIIHLKGKMFMNTNINTCIIYFINDGNKSNIEYYTLNDELIENKITEDKITKTTNEIKYKIKDICVFLPKSKHNVDYGKDSGLYPFFTCSIKGHKFVDVPDFNEEALILNSTNGTGKCNIFYASKYSLSNGAIHFKVVSDKVKTKYLYYYLKTNINLLENGFKGSLQKTISKKYIENIEVKIPPLDVQENIINKAEYLYTKIQQTKDKINDIDNKLKNIFNGI